jgi:putative transposase
MRLSPAEKQEVIELVDRSEDGVNRTLKGLGIHKSTFYKWYHAWIQKGPDGLNPKRATSQQWNSIPEPQKQLVIEMYDVKESVLFC